MVSNRNVRVVFFFVLLLPICAVGNQQKSIAGDINKRLDDITDELKDLVDISEITGGKVCQIESDIDDLSDLSESIFDKTCEINSKIDGLNVDVSISEFDGLQSTADSILDKACDILSIVDRIDDTTEQNNSDIDQLQTTADSILDKVCEINSKIDELSVEVSISEFDELQSTADSILDKACDILSIVDRIDDTTQQNNSDIDRLQTTADSILDKVCLLINPDFALTQDEFPMTITESGTYLLAENVVHTGTGPALVIDVNDVKLNLQNHCINGASLGDTGICVEEGIKNVSIFGGDINNFLLDGIITKTTSSNIKLSDLCLRNTDTGRSAIRLVGTCESSIENVVISNWLSQNTGSLTLERSDQNSISNTHIYKSGNSGLFIDRSERNCIEILAIWDSACHGFEMFAEPGCDNTTRGVKSFRNAKDGFHIDGDVEYEIFIDCQATENGQNGFKLDKTNGSLPNPHDCMFQNCRAFGNGDDGFCFVFGDFFKIVSCQAGGNGGNGFTITSSATNAIFANCCTNGNAGSGFEIGVGAGHNISSFTTLGSETSWWSCFGTEI